MSSRRGIRRIIPFWVIVTFSITAWVGLIFLKNPQINVRQQNRKIILTQAAVSRSPVVVNPHDFDYIINNESLCAYTGTLSYLIYIHSRPSEGGKREIFRRTWAQENVFRDHPSRLVFFLGNPNNATLLADIKAEHAQYGDIVMEDFQDTYVNLTYKAIAGLKWVDRFCLNTKFAIKADQDTYLNMFQFLPLLYRKLGESNRFILGVFGRRLIGRGVCKWCLPDHLLPNQRIYPVFCLGVLYAYPSHLATELYNASLYSPFIHMDDVYITGILRQRLNIAAFHVFYSSYMNHPPKEWSTKTTLIIHGGDTETFWKRQLETLSKRKKELVNPNLFTSQQIL